KVASNVVVHGRTDDGRGPQDGHDRLGRSLAKANCLRFRFDLISEEWLVVWCAKWMAFANEIGIRRMSSIKKGLRPHDEFAYLSVSSRDEGVHCPNALELMSPRRRMGWR